MTSIKLPYIMRLAWETNTTVSTMRCHKLVAEPLVRIFQATLDHYGMEKIRELGLDLYGGCFNNRSIIGGKATSMHAWGIAVDMDPDRNGLNIPAPKAVLSGPEYAAFWRFVEAEGPYPWDAPATTTGCTSSSLLFDRSGRECPPALLPAAAEGWPVLTVPSMPQERALFQLPETFSGKVEKFPAVIGILITHAVKTGVHCQRRTPR